MEKRTITIHGIEIIKQGTQTQSGAPYTLSRVSGDDGIKYSTFLDGLKIGETYKFIVENKPYRGSRDGKMHDGWTITGFDNVAYEEKGELPRAIQQASSPAQSNIGPSTGFTAKDRQTLEAIEIAVNQLVKYTTGA